MLKQAEYIWLDGAKPTQKLRSKTRIVKLSPTEDTTLNDFPEWGFDGSSTQQASGHDSDLVLRPVSFVNDPVREDGNFLVLCEVFNPNGQPHETNTRAQLRAVLEAGGEAHEPVFGFEQEYTLYSEGKLLGFPDRGFPEPQGPFYCGVGSEDIYGRDLIEAHTQACLDADLLIYGTNAEVMPGQWEYQIGYRGFENEKVDALTTCDHRIIAKWLLYRLGEEFNIHPSFENKPAKGDWNGAGCHTNFSTKKMRAKETGMKTIEDAIEKLRERHADHIALYGHALDERLTGEHETCAINEFRSGVADRGASIRIPRHVSDMGYGYLEDRRPGANSDPYVVATSLIATVCGIETDIFSGNKSDKREVLSIQDVKVTQVS